MLSSVLVLAVVTAADPLRLIATFVVISRPRPVQNLLAYLIGCAVLNTLVLLVPLLVLHYTDVFSDLLRGLAGSTAAGGSAVQPVPICMGVVSLLIAAAMTVRLRVRQDARGRRVGREAPLRSGGGATAVSVLETDSSTEFARPLDFTGSSSTEGSVFRRLAGRVHTAWRNGSTWVSVLMGMAYSPVQVTIALTIIATSGAGIGTQLGVAIAFLVVIFAIVEIILVSCVIAPERTQELLRPLHEWVEARRPQVLAVVFAVVGLSLLATGANVF